MRPCGCGYWTTPGGDMEWDVCPDHEWEMRCPECRDWLEWRDGSYSYCPHCGWEAEEE